MEAFSFWLSIDTSRVVATFNTDTKQWKELGEMIDARNLHGVIVKQGQFIVFGGQVLGSASSDEALHTERCTITTDSTIKCIVVGPQLKAYNYPQFMSVTEDFCPK